MLRPSKRSPTFAFSASFWLVVVALFLISLLTRNTWRSCARQNCTTVEAFTQVDRAPKKIWYKPGPKGLSEESQKWIDTCRGKIPSYEYEFLTDKTADTYVREHYKSRPDVLETYLSLEIPILKEDLLRYLLLYEEGGMWSDLDVSCKNTPFQNWVPAEFRKNTSLIVGWESADVGWYRRQFTTIIAEPGSRRILTVINDVLSTLEEKAQEQNATIGGLKLPLIGDVIDVTGPVIFTKSILKSLGLSHRRIIEFAPISAPRLYDDVLVLLGYVFVDSIGQYPPGEEYRPIVEQKNVI